MILPRPSTHFNPARAVNTGIPTMTSVLTARRHGLCLPPTITVVQRCVVERSSLLDSIKLNHRAKYLGHSSVVSV